MRTILTPAALPGAALGELKAWLAITSDADDAPLAALLRTALDMCEAATGLMPLEAVCEEVLTASSEWRILATRPVQAVTGAEDIPAEGPRATLAIADYAVDLLADGGARVRMIRQGGAGRVAVRFVAGLAPDWASLPDGLRHGIIRMAAHLYRQRDLGEPNPVPPAAIVALWRPWRRMRLA